MGAYNFKVNLSPREAYELIKIEQTATLVHEETIDIGEGKIVGILIFEKYYFRASNRAALTVIIDNSSGTTDIRSISTGSSQGMVFNFDWGASDDFAYSVKDILKKYIIE